MKLNNKGWSLNTLLICMAIILSFLLISVLYVYKLSNEFTSNLTGVNNSTNYSNNNSSEISDSINNNNNTLDTKESNSSNNDSSQLDNNQTDNSSTTNAKDKYYMTKESQLQAGTIRYLKENAITIADDETIIINATINNIFCFLVIDTTSLLFLPILLLLLSFYIYYRIHV